MVSVMKRAKAAMMDFIVVDCLREVASAFVMRSDEGQLDWMSAKGA